MALVERHSADLDLSWRTEVRMRDALDLDSVLATRNGVVEDGSSFAKGILRSDDARLKLEDTAEGAQDGMERLAQAGIGPSSEEGDEIASSSFAYAGGMAKYGTRFSAREVRSRVTRRTKKRSQRRITGKWAARRAGAAAKDAAARTAKRAEETAATMGRQMVHKAERVGRFASPGLVRKLLMLAGGLIAAVAFVVLAVAMTPHALTDTELSVAAHLYSKGYTTEAVAAILGNLYEDGYFDGGLLHRAPRPGDFDVDDLSWSPNKVVAWEGYGFGVDDLPGSFEEMSGCDSIAFATWAVMMAYSKPVLKTEGAYKDRLVAAKSYYNSLMYATDARTLVILTCAHSQIGVDYIWGWARPYVGLDCSGLTQWCYRQAGLSIPKHSEAQARALTHVPLEEARAGDILWRSGHVAIYIGDDRYIHAMDEDHGVLFGEGIAKFTCALRWTD